MKQEKALVSDSATNAVKHRPAVPFGSGAVSRGLVLIWCRVARKCRWNGNKSGVFCGIGNFYEIIREIFWAKMVVRYYSVIILSWSSKYRVCLPWFCDKNWKRNRFWNYFLLKRSPPLSLICSDGITNKLPICKENFSKRCPLSWKKFEDKPMCINIFLRTDCGLSENFSLDFEQGSKIFFILPARCLELFRWCPQQRFSKWNCILWNRNGIGCKIWVKHQRGWMKLYSIQNAFAEQNQPSGPHSFVDFLSLMWYALSRRRWNNYGKAYESIKAIVNSVFELAIAF